MIILYNLLQLAGLILFFPFLLVKVIISAKYRRIVPARLGYGLVKPPAGRPRLWIHALSVGEVSSAQPLVEAIRAALPQAVLIFSASTATGYRHAAQTLQGQVDLFTPFPLDFPPIVRKFIRRLAPDLFILIETDFWPNFLDTLRKNHIPGLLANGRISAKSYNIYRKLGFFFVPLFSGFRFISMQTAADAEKLVRLGVAAEKIKALGNLKYDAVLPVQARRDHLDPTACRPPAKIVWVAGSIHAGEERIILNVHKRLRLLFPELFLIIAPRQINRAADIMKAAGELGLIADRRSRPASAGAALLILDTLGELARIYSLGAIAFIGGSLVPEGGHNPLEPAAFGTPVLFGPHMDDFAEISQDLLQVNGAQTVHDEEELFGCLRDWLTDEQQRTRRGEQARALVSRHRGAAGRHLDMILDILKERGCHE